MNFQPFLLIIILIIIVYLIINKDLQKPNGWVNKDAISQYYILVKKYGYPSIFSPKRGGVAIWKKNKLTNTCFQQIELLDESIPHCAPYPHRDFLYTYVNYEIPSSKVLDVISLSGSVAYDPLKKLLRARCGSEEANIGTLYLAVGIGNGLLSIQDVQYNNKYKQVIGSLGNPENVEIYYIRLCEMLKNQRGNPAWSGFFPLAFNKGCCPGYNPNTNSCGEEHFYSHSGDKSNKEAFWDKHIEPNKEAFWDKHIEPNKEAFWDKHIEPNKEAFWDKHIEPNKEAFWDKHDKPYNSDPVII